MMYWYAGSTPMTEAVVFVLPALTVRLPVQVGET